MPAPSESTSYKVLFDVNADDPIDVGDSWIKLQSNLEKKKLYDTAWHLLPDCPKEVFASITEELLLSETAECIVESVQGFVSSKKAVTETSLFSRDKATAEKGRAFSGIAQTRIVDHAYSEAQFNSARTAEATSALWTEVIEACLTQTPPSRVIAECQSFIHAAETPYTGDVCHMEQPQIDQLLLSGHAVHRENIASEDVGGEKPVKRLQVKTDLLSREKNNASVSLFARSVTVLSADNGSPSESLPAVIASCADVLGVEGWVSGDTLCEKIETGTWVSAGFSCESSAHGIKAVSQTSVSGEEAASFGMSQKTNVESKIWTEEFSVYFYGSVKGAATQIIEASMIPTAQIGQIFVTPATAICVVDQPLSFEAETLIEACETAPSSMVEVETVMGSSEFLAPEHVDREKAAARVLEIIDVQFDTIAGKKELVHRIAVVDTQMGVWFEDSTIPVPSPRAHAFSELTAEMQAETLLLHSPAARVVHDMAIEEAVSNATSEEDIRPFVRAEVTTDIAATQVNPLFKNTDFDFNYQVIYDMTEADYPYTLKAKMSADIDADKAHAFTAIENFDPPTTKPLNQNPPES